MGGGHNGAVVAAGGDFDRPDNFEAMDDLVPSPGSVIDFVCEPEEVVPPLPPLDFVPGRRRVMGRGFFVDDGVPLRPPRSLSMCVDENVLIAFDHRFAPLPFEVLHDGGRGKSSRKIRRPGGLGVRGVSPTYVSSDFEDAD